MQRPKKGVTLLELVIAVGILWVWLVSILWLVSRGNKSVDRLRQEIIATNLAREWMEAVYNIRNTNRRRRWWSKDACWLKVDPMDDQWSDGDCSNDDRIQTGSYIVVHKKTSWQEYFALSGITTWPLDISFFDEGIDDQYSLCYTGWRRKSCPGIIDTRGEWLFFREIEGKWLFEKNNNQTWGINRSCADGSTSPCNSSDAKEFRFCSHVAYIKDGNRQIKMCGVLTNFEK